MLGSDLPIETLRSSFTDLYTAYDAIFDAFSDDDRRALFADTARRVYGIGAAGGAASETA
jgi:predicted TIM-barrel fold metal-dependent hydrolase